VTDSDVGGSYSFSLCPDQACAVLTSTKGKVVVQGSPRTNSLVYIALTSGGDVNNVLYDGDTVNWKKDEQGDDQDITFSFWGSGIFNPCSGNMTGHQKGSCKIKTHWYNPVQSFTYDCDVSCSDPIVHLVKSSGYMGQSPLALVMEVFGLLGLGFLARYFWRRHTV
jgi:hypothetical protein